MCTLEDFISCLNEENGFIYQDILARAPSRRRYRNKGFFGGQVYDVNYAPVAANFVANFDNGLEISAQLCVYVEGKCVIDMWGSMEDAEYDGDNLHTVFSSGKELCTL